MRIVFSLVVVCALTVSFASAQPLDISGYKIVQANASNTITLPAGTSISPGGYLVVGRNASQSAFESFWGVTFGSNVVFLNGTAIVAANGFPTINGAETYTLQLPSSAAIEGPTPAMNVGESIQRSAIGGDASIEGSWGRVVQANATPGSGMVNTNSGRLIISEYSDASAFANEFVELYYDVTPPETGKGSASISPTLQKFDDPTTLTIELIGHADTIRGLRFVFPAEYQWSMSGAILSPGAVWQAIGDTILVNGFVAAADDTVIVSIPGVSVSDTTDHFGFSLASSIDGLSYTPLATQPSILVYGSPRPISVIKSKLPDGTLSLLGKWVVARGIVTVANEFGGPSYLQDVTGGLAVYDASVSANIARGDDVILLGIVAPYNELFELAPCSILQKVSEGNTFDTLSLTTAQLTGQSTTGQEPYEGRLVRVNGITSVNTAYWSVTGSGTNYQITDPVGTMEIRIMGGVSLANLPVPTGAFDVVGVLGQFGSAYQLLPRDLADVVMSGQGPQITSQRPYESDPTASTISFSWTTDVPGTSLLTYGTSPALGSTVSDTSLTTTHSMMLSELLPATMYYVRIASSVGSDTSGVGPFVVSTASQSSSGEIRVSFTKSTDASVSLGELAVTADPSQRVIDRINAATYSIDVCIYSLSGTVGANIATALLNAKARGVRLRVIGEKDNQGTAPWGTLKAGGITVIDDSFDASNAGLGLMHNKFYVFDNRDTLSDTDDWVIMGSWNATDPGTNNDAQNIIEIQDKALANAYSREFEEMWGSATDTPDQTASRFGARKTDNTPHVFSIAGVPVQSFFSPSDGVTSHIIRTIDRATTSIDFALLTFTRNDIADALTEKLRAGVTVRGLMDNRTDQGSEFDTLMVRGVDLHLDQDPAFLHHKYVLVDAESSSPDQWVLTGSHNWSSAAEQRNNENTLILKDVRLANLYLQEFKARYISAGGTGLITVHVEQLNSTVPERITVSEAYPNPFNPSTSIDISLPTREPIRLMVTDMLGREVQMLATGIYEPGEYRFRWNAQVASGLYMIVLRTSTQAIVRKAVLLR